MTRTTSENRDFAAVSLFSGAGIGDLGFKAAGFRFISMCEIEPERAALARLNFPEAAVFPGDIREAGSKIVEHTRERLHALRSTPKLIACTAPCQGMSKNGQ